MGRFFISWALLFSLPIHPFPKEHNRCDTYVSRIYQLTRDHQTISGEEMSIASSMGWAEIWRKVGGHNVPYTQSRRIKQIEFIDHYLEAHDPYSLAERLKPLFNRIQQAYHDHRLATERIGQLEKIIKTLDGNHQIEPRSLHKLIGPAKNFGEYAESVKNALTKRDVKELIRLCKIFVETNKIQTEAAANEIIKNFYEYTAALTYLRASAKFEDARGKQAKLALGRLEASFVLIDYFKRLSIPKEAQATPGPRDLYAALTNHPQARLARAKWDTWNEFFSTASWLLPSKIVMGILERAIVSLPGVNARLVRNFFGEFRDSRLRGRFFAEIDRLQRIKDPGAQLRALKALNEDTSDLLLVVIARRAIRNDKAKHLYKTLKDTAEREAQRSSKTEDSFHKRLLDAEEVAKARGPLGSGRTNWLIRRAIDVIAVSLAGIWLGNDYLYDDEDEEPQEDERVLSLQEHHELNALLAQVDLVIGAVQKDPHAREHFGKKTESTQ